MTKPKSHQPRKTCKFCKRRISDPKGTRLYCSYDCKAKASARRGVRQMTGELRREIMKRDNRTCRYCGAPAEEIDHVIPFSKGGADTRGNLVAACWPCNHTAKDKVFCSFQEKKIWLLKTRGVLFQRREFRKVDEEVQRPAWHKFVYGGVRGKR